MNVETFSELVKGLHSRVSQMFGHTDNPSSLAPQLASSVFKEMGVALEELQVAAEELRQQNEALAEALSVVALERKRYQDLFQFASQAYLVTSLEGTIKEAN